MERSLHTFLTELLTLSRSMKGGPNVVTAPSTVLLKLILTKGATFHSKQQVEWVFNANAAFTQQAVNSIQLFILNPVQYEMVGRSK